MIDEGMPVDTCGRAQLANSLAVPMHPLRFLAAQDRDFMPKFRQAEEIGQDLRPSEGVGQAIVGDVEHPGATPTPNGFRHCFPVARWFRMPAHMANCRSW